MVECIVELRAWRALNGGDCFWRLLVILLKTFAVKAMVAPCRLWSYQARSLVDALGDTGFGGYFQYFPGLNHDTATVCSIRSFGDLGFAVARPTASPDSICPLLRGSLSDAGDSCSGGATPSAETEASRHLYASALDPRTHLVRCSSHSESKDTRYSWTCDPTYWLRLDNQSKTSCGSISHAVNNAR